MPNMSRYQAFIDDISHPHQFRPLIDAGLLKIHYDEPLSRHTLAQLGGPADVLITLKGAANNQNAFCTLAQLAWHHNLPLRILGGGANVLLSDAGFRGVVLINSLDQIRRIDDGQRPDKIGRVAAGSGVSLSRLTRFTIENGLSGFEWAISVPGTVGGAVVNNAGAHGRDMAANLFGALIWVDNGNKPATIWPVEKLKYSYRESVLKHSGLYYVVLAAYFRFESGHAPAELRARADEYVAHRKRTQPPGASLGSMFKNPPDDYAGRLIEAAGLKGVRSGGVIISPIHANFFVNTGSGTASDYVALIRLTRDAVREKFGVNLELEIELIGEGFD